MSTHNTGKAPFEWINKDASNLTSKDYKKKANSHAQSVAWGLRKNKSNLKKSSAPTRQSRLPLHNTFSRQGHPQVEYDSEVDVQGQGVGRVTTGSRPGSSFRRLSDPASDSVHLLNAQLDPFMSLAGNTTCRERNLLQFYLTVIPLTVYGTHNTSAYCPVRDRTAIFVQSNNEWLQWVLLSAEVFMLGNMAAKDSVSVLSRRASLYQTIREAVSNSATRYSDTTIAHITLAAAAEDRIGLRYEAQKHLAAAKRLIIDRGDGGQRIPITTVADFIWLGTGADAFPDSGSLEVAIASFTSALFAFHQCGWGQEGHSAMLKQPITTMQDSSDGLLYAYIQSRRRAFHPLSPLRPFVEPVFQDQSVSQMRSHMAILWVLNRILWDLRYNYEDSINFLDMLYLFVATADLANLKALTVLFMIMDCTARLGMDFNEQTHNITDIIVGRGDGDCRIMWWWETVEAVEVQLLLSKETRERILHVLSAELVESEINRDALTESFVVRIADEIRLGWLYQELDRPGGNRANFA